MILRIPFLLVLRVHLVVMAVASGGLFEIDRVAPPTSPVMWFSEERSITEAAIAIREEALFVDLSASSDAAHAR